MSTDAEPSGTPLRILVVEDSATQAQRLQHLLERHGYQVAIASNGRLGLEMARQSPPALIISDVVMPEMDGYELSQRIKADRRLQTVPLILVTTMSDPQDVIRGLQCGADSFILKPFAEQYLLGRVQYALFNRDMRSPQESGSGVEVHFNGERHLITAGRLRILNLLLSTYDAAIQRNRELKRGQEELRSLNAQLEEANKELESFSYSVSHDLRAPLRHIQGYVGMLREDEESSISGEGQRYLDVIEDASRQMAELIDDLLALSRMARVEMLQTQVNLDQLLGEALAGMEMDLRGRDIIWTIPSLPRVRGDVSLLRQVLVNLLSNAVKYTRPRKPARIEIGCAADEAGRVVLFVRDNGVGFDMDYAGKLFGVFQRLHRANEFEGTGIGLANVRQIIARHGGRVWAHARPDQGATFYLTLAVASEEDPSVSTVSKPEQKI